MGQKVHPYGCRLGFNRTWHSRWFSTKEYQNYLHEDLKLRKELKARLSHAGVSEIDIERFANKLKVNIQTSRPGTDAQLVAESIALQLERRVAFRRAMKKGIESAFRFGAQGIKIRCAGRLNGAEIARAEWYQEGRLPLHTLKADIDYGFAESNTTYGKIGVKTWIYRGEQHKAKTRRKTA